MTSFFRRNFGALTKATGVFAILFAVSVQPGCLEAWSKHNGDKPLRPDPALAKTLDGITPQSLTADLSFLASDALQGRDTPSPGLEAAAEFIASRFRSAGLTAPVNGTYFQVADLTAAAKKESQHSHYKLTHLPVIGRNVIGILPGSDPKLKDTYVIVSAHYDHIGTVETAEGRTAKKVKTGSDQIYNGADDDGSGTASVIALAEAFSRLHKKPRRSIVFMTFCGEELGLLGSLFYADHPVVPLQQTIADINLEQVGRTDGDIKKGSASLTGYEYTDIGQMIHRAGLAFGLNVYQDRNGDRYFDESDNLSFARRGIPDTTICAAFEFPDYHGLGDEWRKIDYPAMTVIDRVVGTALWALADSRTAPEWNPAIKQTADYRSAAAHTYGTD